MEGSSVRHPHPLSQLSVAEFTQARDIITKIYGPEATIFFRSLFVDEPKKADLIPYLEAEHADILTDSTQRPPRCAAIEYDVVTPEVHEHVRAVVNVETAEVVKRDSANRTLKPYYTPGEFALFQDICVESQLFKDAMSEFTLPEGFTVTIDPWPYGPDEEEETPRIMQGLVFARDSSQGNADANHYAYPIPIIPVMDWVSKDVIRVDRLATGGKEDNLKAADRVDEPKKLFHNSKHAEYAPELLDQPLRQDLKPLNVVQPQGASFKVHPDGLVEWQKWRFRLGFTPREGSVLHDICYENRPILYRLSYSELTVPYGDPRPPYHRKQAFDLGDGGFGRAANNLELGCDCLGAIHYFDSNLAAPDGSPTPAKNVVCLHEQDNGILWKHTNFRTNRAVVTRMRELVVQCIVTLANYEYVLLYKLDLAGGITIETRATGVMSVVPIDESKTSEYGNVVAPGILAQNHQHLFAVRIDPAIDSYADGDTQIMVEESHTQKIDVETNPYGNYYKVERRPVEHASWLDAEPKLNRTVKLENMHKVNEMSQRNVGYKLISPATQTILADPESINAKRAPFAQHHFWFTGYRDGELWAAGEFTNQSREEQGGVNAMVQRRDWFTKSAKDNSELLEPQPEKGQLSSPVVWSVFGLTHNPRVEDWPVMPVEIHQMHLRPADFFSSNPALDVPSSRNQASVLIPCCGQKTEGEGAADSGSSQENQTENAEEVSKARSQSVQENPSSHSQGVGPDIDAKKAGANVEEDKEKDGLKRRLSRTVKSLFGSEDKDVHTLQKS